MFSRLNTEYLNTLRSSFQFLERVAMKDDSNQSNFAQTVVLILEETADTIQLQANSNHQ
jgi:hypothetical protein